MDADKQYLQHFESSLSAELTTLLTAKGLLSGSLLTSDDFYQKWDEMADSYVADSIKEIADYPAVSLGWAMYLGMAVAFYWDKNLEIFNMKENLYEYIRDKRGYDYLDETVRENILGLCGKDFDEMENTVRECAQSVLSRIHHEQVEPQSPMAYHIYVSSVKVLYHIGVSVALKRLGYKMEKVGI